MSSIASKIETLVAADDLPQRIELALRGGHRGARRQKQMSPELSYGRHAGPAPHTARHAAVMLLLFRRRGRWHLPLTERPATLSRHAGQISLPGGSIEIGESSLDAARREVNEELGFDAPSSALGRLADCYVFASDFLVTPWVVASSEADIIWRPHDREVQDVVELPLATLLDDDSISRLTIQRGPLVFHAPCIAVGSARIWGATCTILSELAGVLRYLLETSL
ncbi:MAG TPA: CoA pyrophosphatase [Lacipirellulaceae bacterium]|nr:CoA pyrophosphatase [Lacipirellulaceae bacterium]